MPQIKQNLTSFIPLLLIFLSLSTLYLYKVGIYTTFKIDLTNQQTIVENSDAFQGGNSTASIKHTKNGFLLNCNIKVGYEWPFCQAKINLSQKWEGTDFDASKGIDLSEYDEIFLRMKHQGQAPHRVRIYIRNYNKAYTNLDSDENSMKLNEIEFSPNRHPQGKHISLDSFQVPGWWSNPREVPLEYSGSEFTNISLIEVNTASMTEMGTVSILVEEISFRKQLIPKEYLLISMLVVWLISALLYYVFRLHHSTTTLQRLEATLDELTQTQKQLVESEKLAALGNLVAGVAHEINTPLGVSITYTSVIADTAKNLNDQVNNNQLSKKRLTEQLDTLIQSSEGTLHNLRRADMLITSFKHLAVNADTSQRNNFSFLEVINDTVLTLHNTLKQSNHNVEINCPESLQIYSYPGAISQILIGLIDNSIKHAFANKQEGTINISVVENGNMLTMVYSDNGCGIQKGHIDKVLDPFFTTKRNKGHVGLGLNTLHNVIVKMLNGKLDIYSDGNNSGTMIKISFPINAEHELSQ